MIRDRVWESLNEEYDILTKVKNKGHFIITADEIRKYKEPRLVVKFDHESDLPQLFRENKMTILPISRGAYYISQTNAYHWFEEQDKNISIYDTTSQWETLNALDINSEIQAINFLYATGLLETFVEDTGLVPTVSGRMSSGEFSFEIESRNSISSKYIVDVKNAQIEIDAAFEGEASLILIEAKMELASNFLVRQLYYPYKRWVDSISKRVRPIFLIFSNGIFYLYEYKFLDKNLYNSIKLVRACEFIPKSDPITVNDLQNILDTIQVVDEPSIPFPQADDFKRVINICELINAQSVDKYRIKDEQDFVYRQADYYTSAARYLGLIEQSKENKNNLVLTEFGKLVFGCNYRDRQLLLCKAILGHKPFYDTLVQYFEQGTLPEYSEIINFMKYANVHGVGAESTFIRRSRTIKSWINWIVDLINQD